MKYLFFFSFLLFMACSLGKEGYELEIMEWRKERITNLTAAISWSSLSGLYWLKSGRNMLGSSRDADIRFPEEAERVLGYINYEGDSLIFEAQENVEVFDAESQVSVKRMFSDIEENTTRLNSESYFFTAIDRNDKIGIRIWDTLHIGRTLYKNLDYYPIDPKMRVRSTFVSYDEPKITTLKNVLGMDVKQEITGYLEFEINEKKYRIAPLDGGPEEFFLIFADETTGGETYGGGRYLYCPKPDDEGITYIDFNKAYTPPCGFTEFATCLLPSKENTFPIAIEAGEMYDASFH